jgi:hypothetical protein
MAKSPAHYTRGAIEVWDFVRDQDLNYHLGNAIKYICRAGYKLHASKTEDLEKAIHYLQNELEHTIYESELTGPSGGIPHSLQFSCDWEDSGTDPEMFDR